MVYTHIFYGLFGSGVAYYYDKPTDTLYHYNGEVFIQNTEIEFQWFHENFIVEEVNVSLENE